MTSNIHPVVELLVARMESHPEEFEPNGGGRWAEWLDRLIPFVTEKERVMLRKPMMQTIHEEVLDELLNGPDKRRKQEEEREYERNLIMQQAQVAQQNSYAQQNTCASQLGSYQNAMAAAQGLTHGSGGAGLPVFTSPYSSGGGSIIPVANGGTGITGKSPTSIWMDESASIGSVTDTFAASLPKPTTINQIKKALGIKK